MKKSLILMAAIAACAAMSTAAFAASSAKPAVIDTGQYLVVTTASNETVKSVPFSQVSPTVQAVANGGGSGSIQANMRELHPEGITKM